MTDWKSTSATLIKKGGEFYNRYETYFCAVFGGVMIGVALTWAEDIGYRKGINDLVEQVREDLYMIK